MAHMLARLRGVKANEIKKVLKADAYKHAEEGLYLKYLWQNVDDSDEVLFLFEISDLIRAKRFIQKVHTQALQEDPSANLPHMTFLEEQ
jgi:hypothetical protein